VAASEFRVVLDELETEVLRACSREAEWPAQVAAGVYAGIDFAIARPAIASELVMGVGRTGPYESLVGRLAGFIRINAPVGARLPASTDEALVAGIVGLVGDHVRIGRIDRLAELRPELVLLTLLPYLGFAEAQLWANRVADQTP
jgi:hypothetical protein